MTSFDSQTIQSPPRRSWLKILLSLGVLGLFSRIGRATGAFLLPQQKENGFGTRIKVGPITDIPTQDAAPKLYPAGKFWLVNNDQRLTALHSSCTHLNCLFTWDSNKGVFVCPCHGSEFSRRGEVLNGPATRNLDSFPVEITDADDQLVASSETGLELAAIPAANETGDTVKLTLCVDTGRKIKGETNPVS